MTALRSRSTRRLAVAVCVTALLAGCALRQAAPDPEPVSEPRTVRPLGAILEERDRALQSLRGLARISYRAAGKRRAFNAAVLVRRPHRLRLEAFSLVGAALILTVDDDEVIGFLPSEARFYRARTSRQNLFRATELLLELEEMVALMMGLPPVRSDAAWRADGLALRRTRAGGGTDVLTFDAQIQAPVRWQRFGPSGAPWYVATFEDFADTSAGLFPLKITLETPPLKRSYQIRYDKPELNVTLPDFHFVQELPEGAVRIPLPTPTG